MTRRFLFLFSGLARDFRANRKNSSARSWFSRARGTRPFHVMRQSSRRRRHVRLISPMTNTSNVFIVPRTPSSRKLERKNLIARLCAVYVLYLSDRREEALAVLRDLCTRAEIEFRVDSLPEFRRVSFDVFAEHSAVQSHIGIHNGQESKYRSFLKNSARALLHSALRYIENIVERREREREIGKARRD
ncbi:hypothetical protein PUN28_005856 [Cardiocondyla obscurior]|uniref:Uncharacterized protein n=1 Tax=Cardiocondyla obscurior TaxID=286306 RepID=A0AAW2G5U6_9HYME